MTESDFTNTKSRLQQIAEAHPELFEVEDRAQRIQHMAMRFQLKSARLYQLADELHTMVAPYVVCKSGCNYCCHMVTMIFQHEAEAMAKASGRKARKLPYRPIPLALKQSNVYSGQVCPFLKDGRCSIYEHRPLICRLHNSLNDDPADCRINPGGGHAPVASVDPDWVEVPYILSVLAWRPWEPYGAIQEFFPT